MMEEIKYFNSHDWTHEYFIRIKWFKTLLCAQIWNIVYSQRYLPTVFSFVTMRVVFPNC